MERRTATRPLCRAPGLILIAVCVLLLTPAVALGVDGVPLYPPGIDANYAWTSMEHPDMSGPILTFEIFGLSDPASPPVVKNSTARIMFWNAANGFNRNIGSEVPGLPDGADQRHSSVIDRGGDVYIVWQQWNDPFTAPATSGCGAATSRATPTWASRCCSSRAPRDRTSTLQRSASARRRLATT